MSRPEAESIARKHFYKEARIARVLDHPNIVRVPDRDTTAAVSQFGPPRAVGRSRRRRSTAMPKSRILWFNACNRSLSDSV